MQKHKKQVDGLSDSSSIGSIMDDTDQEVSSLTDRAFRSLCIAEEDNINQVISQSPDVHLQFSRKRNEGSLKYAFHYSHIFNKQSLQTKEHIKSVSAFKQLPRFAHEEKDDSRFSTSDILALPAPDPRNKKQRSKVSSLIKTFDNIENEHPWSSPSVTRKLCMPKSSQKLKLISEKEYDPWETTTVMGMPKELSEFSHACQENYWLNDKYNKQRRKLKKEVCHAQDSFINAALTASHIPGSNVYNFPQKTRKQRTEGDKELRNQSNFLHSENSAFKSWSDHSRKMIGKEEYSDSATTKECIHWYEDSSPLNVISQPVHKTLFNKSAMGASQEKEAFMKVGSSKSPTTKSLVFLKPEKEATRKTGPPLALHSKTVNSVKQMKEVVMDVSSSPPPPPPPPPSSKKKPTVSCQDNALKDINYPHSAPSNKHTIIPMVTNIENEILMDVDPFLSPSLYAKKTTVLNQEQDSSLNKNYSPSLLTTKKVIVQNQGMDVPMGLSSFSSISHSKKNIVPHLEKEVFMDVSSPISSELSSNMTTNVGQGKDVLMNEMSSLSSSFNKKALIKNQEKDDHVGKSFSWLSSQGKKIIAKNQEKKGLTNADYSVLTSPVVKRTAVGHREHEDNMGLGFSSLTKNAAKNSNMISNLKTDIDMAGGSESAAAAPPSTKKLLASKQDNKAIVSEVTSSSEIGEVHCMRKPFSSESRDELGNNSAPWRKPKVIKTLETLQEISNQNPKEEDISMSKQYTVTNQENMQTNWTDSDSLSFNITQLLTPVIQRKHEKDSLEDQTVLITPPLAEMTSMKEQECQDIPDYKTRDNYKSKAPSLLFNLKDVRKRVKSTYSTSPLLKNMEEKNKFTDNVQDNMKSNVTTLNLQEKSNRQDGIKSIPTHLHAMQNLNSQEDGNRNGKIEMNRQVTDNYLTLSSPQTTEDNSFYHSGDHLQEYPTTQETFEDVEFNKNVLFGQQTKHQNLRKWVDYPSLKLYKKENRESSEEQHIKRSQESNQLQVSDIQDYTIMENSEQQNQNHNINAPSLSHLPQIEDIHFDEKQIALLVSNDNIDRGCGYSSKQPYLNLADKIYLEQEEQKYFIERHMGGESEKHVDTGQEIKENCKNLDKDELQYYALSNVSTKIEDKNQIKVSQNESQECSKDSLMRELADKQEDDCLNSSSEKSLMKSSSLEVPQRTSSASYKPNMFTVKDITFKSSPVIKAVKLPLLRSMSEDSIICGRKKIESHFEDSTENEASIFRELQYINDHEGEPPLVLNVKSQKAKQMTAHKNTQRLKSASKNSKPVIRTPFLEDTLNFSLQNVKEDLDESREKHSLLESPKTHNEERQSKIRNKNKPDLIKTKCNSVDETTFLEDSLHCTAINSNSEDKELHGRHPTLMNQRLILKNKINDEITSSPPSSALEDPIYSPVTSKTSDGIHFTDANSFSDDIACSTVISPMSESISYSIVPNPVLEKILSSTIISPMSENILCSSPISNTIPSSEPTAETMSYSLTTRSASENTNALDRTSATAIPEHIVKYPGQNVASKTKGQSIPVQKTMPNDRECDKVEHEHSQRIGNTGKMLGKPPTVPPKSEKALRRAKRLNNKRRKTEALQRKYTEKIDANSVLMMPSPPPSLSMSSSPSLVHLHSFTPTDPNIFRYADTQTTAPSPSFPMTQRKLLQDPDSGQYFMVDIPVQVHLKTFYDPETGKYIQMSIPSSGDNLSQASFLEVLNNPYAVCPSLIPLPVTSLTTARPSSQLSAPATLMLQHHKEESRGNWNHDHTYSEYAENQPYIEPVCESHSQHIKGTPYNLEKDFTGSRSLDIISTNDLDDFATDGVS
uniref:Cardiac-enriched FHL2-interacting protein n=1 Tax=Geotrypetes seraphini TaxID=260995 RepID=A0A6P8QQN2_GEOSA|nr:cardiac-enriched FHL2-interacting protein [Geotrypetes seraphini]XP_033798186.1 cardiac-enriched FHL2-interacting protein [Geotrypetes seraphini]XP_033798187.1 cardiac-enriched FHL2-interacting protein [Geotrypetes seraphini]XP_033798188.1 cardiac-enriched FHL2-interacting protein [Geotrypetes seraphini]XP_033798189.1 cardiac-enriched FHL2-interacting protein [Geotrypetes seraphini]XP_033798190.1 cardiac-enriched FHL2-interacting protein [Geotrypetes seraphini]XP_033798191.1 cardiac-enrich